MAFILFFFEKFLFKLMAGNLNFLPLKKRKQYRGVHDGNSDNGQSGILLQNRALQNSHQNLL